MTETGLNIKKRRIELGMSAEELAETIGVNPTTIYVHKLNLSAPLKTYKTRYEIAKSVHFVPNSVVSWRDLLVESTYKSAYKNPPPKRGILLSREC